MEQAVASVRLAGLEPGAEALAIFQRYVEGEISLEQVGSEIGSPLADTRGSLLFHPALFVGQFA